MVTGHLGTVIDKLHLRVVIWFDSDGIPALGLHDQPGVLRPNGQVFRDYVAAHAASLD